MSFIFLEWTLRSINMNFLSFPNGFEALMLRKGHSFVFVDPMSLKQQIYKVGTSIT